MSSFPPVLLNIKFNYLPVHSCILKNIKEGHRMEADVICLTVWIWSWYLKLGGFHTEQGSRVLWESRKTPGSVPRVNDQRGWGAQALLWSSPGIPSVLLDHSYIYVSAPHKAVCNPWSEVSIFRLNRLSIYSYKIVNTKSTNTFLPVCLTF